MNLYIFRHHFELPQTNPCKKKQTNTHTRIPCTSMQARPNQPITNPQCAPRVVCHQPSSKDKIHLLVRHEQPRPKCHVSVPLAPLRFRKQGKPQKPWDLFFWGWFKGWWCFVFFVLFFSEKDPWKKWEILSDEWLIWEVFISSRIYNMVYQPPLTKNINTSVQVNAAPCIRHWYNVDIWF